MKHPTNEGGCWASECFGSMPSRKAASMPGTIPGGLRMKDGQYVNICPYYHEL